MWCNGNTTASGAAVPGSSPGIPANKKALKRGFFIGCVTGGRRKYYKDKKKPSQTIPTRGGIDPVTSHPNGIVCIHVYQHINY
jgi:hypothetical protein